MSQEIREAIGQQLQAFYAMVPERQIPGPTAYFNVNDFILDRGRSYESQALTEEEMVIVLTAARFDGGSFEQKQCYNNAARLVAADLSRTLVYCEGLAHGAVMPVNHAWATINGKVVDLTWRVWADEGEAPYLSEGHPYQDRIIGLFGGDRGYLGIEVQTEALIAHHEGDSPVASLIDNWYDDWPMLQQPRLTPIPADWATAREAYQHFKKTGTMS